MENQISKNLWIEELHKIVSLYKSEEKNLIQTFLQNDYHLNKIYNSLCINEIQNENKIFFDIQKQLKFYINEAFSYLMTKKASYSNNNEFKNKIKKIDDLIIKIRKDFKNKFEVLLNEEDKLEKEILEYDKNFETYFNFEENEEKKINENNENFKNNNNNQNVNSNNKLNKIDEYIENIMKSNGVIYNNNINEVTYDEVEKIIKKLNIDQLNIIKAKINDISKIIEENLGGVNCGWQIKEQEEFLKLKNYYKNKINSYEFLTALSNTIPYLPSSELKNHIKNYIKYQNLYEIKKLLLKKYKELKDEIDNNNKLKLLEKIKNEKTKEKNEKKDKLEKEKTEYKKKLIKEWKDKKNYDNNIKYLNEKKLEKLKKEKEREIYLINKMKNQNLINEYHKKKEEELNKNYLSQNNAPIEINKFDFERIKEREDNLLQKKKDAIRAKSSKKFRVEENYAKYKLKQSSKMNKIKSKINESTDAARNKQRNKFNPDLDTKKDACTMANNMFGHMNRAIPLWRRGLNN